MVRLLFLVSILLMALGFLGFFGWELVGASKQSPTALAPAAIGSLMFICGLFTKMSRPIGIHAAVFVALLGVIGSMVPLIKRGFDFSDAAVKLSGAGALIMIYFIVTCVRSFLAARRARKEAPQG